MSPAPTIHAIGARVPLALPIGKRPHRRAGSPLHIRRRYISVERRTRDGEQPSITSHAWSI